MPISQLLDQKYAQVRAQCAASKRALVAFSGGVDSTLLAKIAYDVLGDNAIAVTADSESMPRREFREAEELAREIGIRYLLPSRAPGRPAMGGGRFLQAVGRAR